MVDYTQNQAYTGNIEQTKSQAIAKFMTKVYSWMFAGLSITAITSYYIFSSGIFEVFAPYMIILMLANLGLVFFLSARIEKISASTASIMFIVYSLMNGITFSVIFATYTASSIAQIFGICALMFLALSVIGFVTKKDLTGMGTFMMMGVIGIIIASIFAWIFNSSALYMAVSVLGVIIFAGLTAYDTQKIKESYIVINEGKEVTTKFALMGALNLYLDFINLFLFLLRLLGSRD